MTRDPVPTFAGLSEACHGEGVLTKTDRASMAAEHAA